ncbi:BsuPI-related putative proteinase inhibitor [Cohnella massiliensis]|uniref:BsuPI-related putative proteinase inhibitor n=1 Tax=Cohnella massiliensis TaxID=1816691 RepID=UPI001592CB2F|nr:BsuPI-related putative proteinase inhibitor [Cohnella massiliensis]
MSISKHIVLLLSLTFGLMGCSDIQKTLIAMPDDVPSCKEPPSSFTWGQQTYTLKTIGSTDLEPGMKLGYLNCQNGVYTQQGEGENATFNIYSYGSPLDSDDLLYFGKWGRALYTPAKENPKAQVKINESIQIIDDSKHVSKSEVREIRLDPQLEKELLEKKQPMQGLFETTMDTVKADGKIDIHFSLKNISGKDLKIVHGSGQRYDFWVYNEKDEEVYRWSYNKAFTAALIERELKKSEKLEFDEVWHLKDNEGEPVPPGKYTVVVMVMIGLESGTISQDELITKSIIEVNQG